MTSPQTTEDKLRAQLREGHRLTDEEWDRRNTTGCRTCGSRGRLKGFRSGPQNYPDHWLPCPTCKPDLCKVVSWLFREADGYAAHGLVQFAGAYRTAAAAIERGDHER